MTDRMGKIAPTVLAALRRSFAPVDILPLVFFRIAFGIIMLWEVWRYFHYNRIARYYIEPAFHFRYFGFEWLHPLPGDGMFWLFYALGVLSIMILVGLFYRASMTLFWLGFTYVFLLDQTQYLNHFYLISLVSLLLIFVPAHRAVSIDALLRPGIRSQTAPSWSLWLIRGQMAVVYIFGGLAKINSDWLRGEPMRQWLAARTDFPVIGQYFTEEWMVYGFSYGGMLFDLLIVPMLFWRRTRLLALLLAFVFHLTNYRLFNIGVFPWFSLAITFLFLPPHWFRLRFRSPDTTRQVPVMTSRQWVLIGAIAIYFAVQVVVPLRHWLYPGYVSWTEEGHNVSWRMKLRGKSSEAHFFAYNPDTGDMWYIAAEDYLTQRQIGKMSNRPVMILRFAHHLADEMRAAGHDQIQIRAWVMASLNSRARQLLIDPTADLSVKSYDLRHADWILPLMQLPSPAPAQETLIVSRRHDGALVLVNATEEPFPLWSLQFGAGDRWISGADFDRSELALGECVVVHTTQTNPDSIFPNCTEVSTRLHVEPEFAHGSLNISINGTESTVCDGTTCLISLAQPPPPESALSVTTAATMTPTTPSIATRVCEAQLPDGWVTYHLQEDDTLSSLAAATGTTTDELVSVNCLDQEHAISSGQLFFVPR